VATLRTPDDRFRDLAGWPFPPRYLEIGGYRMHYVDEGDPGADPILLLHGEPSWSYLYRKMIPPLAAAGHRVLAPDLIGFGRSDKPASGAVHTYSGHVAWLAQFLRALDLRRITLVCQDWGGLLGLRLATENPERFARIAAANTALPDGLRPPPPVFRIWQAFARWSPWFPIGRIIQAGTVQPLTHEARAAYDAPFPGRRYKAGPRRMPLLVPLRRDDPEAARNREAWVELERWEKPFLTAFSDGDPITRGSDRLMRERIPGAAGQPHTTIRGGGHFLQEDRGPELARVVIDWIAAGDVGKGRGSASR
jgi:haloalkane dehalogenase